MTTVHQVFTVRSFRSAKDRDFVKALQLYDAQTHPLVKTDSREIAHWLQHGWPRNDSKFYVCGLFVSGVLVGFVEFIHLREERFIHFDYFIIDPMRRTAGAFHTFAEQMKLFFLEEHLEWDFITAEIAQLDPVNGVSRHAQRLIRLFRQVGFYEILAEYRQPHLGVQQTDTPAKATLLLLPRVEMETISRSRFLELVSAIYRKHYVEWYTLYAETAEVYRNTVEQLFAEVATAVSDRDEIQLRGPDREFADGDPQPGPPVISSAVYVAKVLASALAAGAFHFLLKHQTQFTETWIIGVAVSVFILLVVTVSLTDKKRFEAFKLIASLVGKFFDR
jgi:hypothetical protein